MVNILYGVCGEGLGHASRSRILINYLKKNHEIRIVAGGKAYAYLSREFDHVTEIESARFYYRNNQVLLIPSMLRMGYRTLAGSIPSFFTVRRIINEFKPQMVITDADPISHYAARFTKNLKRLSIDNPHAMIYRNYSISPSEWGAWFTLYVAAKSGMYGADKYIVYDFFDEQSKDPRVLFIKPVIQEGILQQKPRYGDHVFVYQTIGADPQSLKILKQFDEKFVIYGFNKRLMDGNLVFKEFNEHEFYKDIAQAKAVITNGGFTVISEALYLKKPMFILPITNQFEQILNGKFVEILGVGISRMTLEKNALEEFFQNFDKYREHLQRYNPGEQRKTLEKIEKEIKMLTSELSPG